MLPVKRTSKSRKRRRRSHHGLTAPHTVPCPGCGKAKLPHAACSDCGYVRKGFKLPVPEKEE